MTPVQLALTGLELRDQGIASLERHGWVHEARKAAVLICYRTFDGRRYGPVTSDDVHDVMVKPPHPNAYGAIFKDKRFTWTGEWVQSKRPEAHARMIRVWRLV
jgi:hypothetical protein